MTEQVQTQESVPATDVQSNPVQGQTDPFSIDENSLISLSPEQRASLDPIITNWKKKASEEISRRDSDIEKYKAYGDKASALDKLTQYQPFVQWWNQEQARAKDQASTVGQKQAIGNTQPTDIATQSEWQDAIYNASIGDGSKLQALQARTVQAMAAPYVQQLQSKQQTLDAKLELRDLFEDHPDAKDLDTIGLDPRTKEGTSLLEMGLDWAERNGKSYEEGYLLARRWADSMKVTEQQRAMGMVTEKKQSVTQGPSTSSANHSVIEVGSVDELLKRSMEAQMSGNKDARFVLKK
jgi:hypothetical protein